MKKIFNISITPLTVIVVFVVSQAFCQPPQIEWSREYGGSSSDEAYSVQQTTDGGFIFAGYTKSFGADSNDVYLVKTDSFGNTQWYQMFGGTDYDAAYSVQQIMDGDYIVAGLTYSYGAGGGDMYLVKTNDHGDTLWTRTFGGDFYEEARSIRQTSDGGYIVAGRKEPIAGALTQMYLVKTDSLGDTLWTRSYGGTDNREAYSTHQTEDGGFIIVGCNPFWGGVEYNIYLVKTDNQGDTIWTNAYGVNNSSGAQSVEQTMDGGYIIAGWSDPSGTDNFDVYIVKTDSLGDIAWTRSYGRAGLDYAYSVQQTPDEGYIISGTTWTLGTLETNLYLIRLDNLGDTLWTLVYGGTDSEYGLSVDQTNDGGYIIAASIFYSNPEEASDCWLVKTGPDTSTSHAPVIEWVSHPKDFILHPAYPNPFNPTTIISYDVPLQGLVKVNIYNTLGQKTAELMNSIITPGHHQLTWNATDSPSGIYFIQLQSQGNTQIRKIVLMK